MLVAAKLYLIPGAERQLRIAQALEFMDLGEAGHRPVCQYSGGMIRRLEIAQSMLHRPVVLFCFAHSHHASSLGLTLVMRGKRLPLRIQTCAN